MLIFSQESNPQKRVIFTAFHVTQHCSQFSVRTIKNKKKTNPFRPQSDLIMKYFFFQINILSSKIYQSPSLFLRIQFDAILSVR